MLSEARIENEERDLLVVRGDRWCWSGTRGCLLLAAIGIEWAQQRQQQRQQSLLRSACSERGQMLCCWCCSSGTSLLSAARRIKFALRRMRLRMSIEICLLWEETDGAGQAQGDACSKQSIEQTTNCRVCKWRQVRAELKESR